MISIVIPVYNVAKYLLECVQSVINQTYTDFEILLIDDGSTDSSKDLCDSLQSKDCRIKVFHKKNGGLSSARNYGIENALGEYIIFLDSDDYWMDPDILSLLMAKAKSDNLDVVRGEYIEIDDDGNVLFVPNKNEIEELWVNQVFSSYEMMKYVVNGRYFSWLFMFKKSAIENLRFDENRKFQEDIDFAIRFFSHNMRCGYLPIQFYAYRQRQNSIMSTPRISNLEGSFTLCNVFYEYAYKVEDKRLTPYYIYIGIMMYYWTLETVAGDIYINRYNEIEKKISLVTLRKKVYSWTKQVPQFRFPIHIYVPPYVGVCLFRIRWMGGKFLRALKIIK